VDRNLTTPRPPDAGAPPASPRPARTARGTAEPVAAESTPHLLSGLLADLRDLGSAHALSLRSEVSQELSALATSLKLFMVALSVLTVGVVLLFFGLAGMLADAVDIEVWWSYLGFAVVMVGGGYALLRAANPAKRVADGHADLVPETALADAKDSMSFVSDEMQRVVRSDERADRPAR
jgi:hypothetical protein